MSGLSRGRAGWGGVAEALTKGQSGRNRPGSTRRGQGRVEARQNCGGRPHSLAGDVPTLLVDHAGSVETAAALVHLTPWSLEVGGAAALPGAVRGHLACAQVLAVARALPCGWGWKRSASSPTLMRVLRRLWVGAAGPLRGPPRLLGDSHLLLSSLGPLPPLQTQSIRTSPESLTGHSFRLNSPDARRLTTLREVCTPLRGSHLSPPEP